MRGLWRGFQMSYECPTCGKDGFKRERDMKVHHTHVHGETLVEPEISECNYCGEEFEVGDGSTGTYCSLECMGLDNVQRVELTCIQCDEEFDVPPSDAEGRKFCSQTCRTDSMPSKYEHRSCEMCARKFKTIRSGPARFCSRSCESERKAEKPRPDDPDMLLWLLYVYEDFNHRKTWERQRAVLGVDEALTQAEVRERLVDMGVFETRTNMAETLSEMDPDELGEARPAGDDSWRNLYSTG